MFTDDRIAVMRSIVLEQFTHARTDAARGRAQKFLYQEIISSSLYPDISLKDENPWADRDARSHERHLHGFLFFTDWFGTVLEEENTKDEACRAALKIVESWLHQNGEFPGNSRMAFHDETTAQRLIILLQLEPILSDSLTADSVSLVRSLIDETASLITEPAFHSAGNNHGMFQDLSLLYYSVLAHWKDYISREEYARLAFKRLEQYFSSCFTAEGVHVENTPTYHLMVCRQMSVVRRLAEVIEHPDAEQYAILLDKAETYATHALMPNGLYPPISDTAQRPVNNPAMRKVFSSPEFLYAASAGQQGVPPTERVLALPDTGYLVYRSSWEDRNATYVFFSAAYNSGYHKHSDDLSLFLRSGDLDLLAESGPFSYDYKDPLSRYAYSQFSHNSLVVDGRSLPRTDDRSDAVTLRVEEKTPDRVVVQGSNARYDDTLHTRRLEIHESHSEPLINVSDIITSGADHAYQLLWNLGPNVTAVVHGQGFELFRGDRKVFDLIIDASVPTRMSVHRGRMKPRPMGWTFPEFGKAIPSTAISVEFSGKDARIDTAIRLADFSYRDRGIFYKDGWRRYRGSVSLNYLFCPSPKDGGTTNLVVCFTAIHQPGDFTYNYKSTIDETGAAALYILDDFGDQGAYYYSDHGSTAIFETVQDLIKHVMAENGLDVTRVATVGSSKGGTAALIHGLALGADRIIVGAPQVRVGSFLRGPHPNILQFMTGGTTENDVAHLDSVIPNILASSASAAKIFVVVGEADHHRKNHVVPLIAAAENYGVDIHPLILPGVPHAEIGKIFTHYLRANIEHWIDGAELPVLPYKFLHSPKHNSFSLEVNSPADTIHSYQLYRNSVVVENRLDTPNRKAVFTARLPGIYRIGISYRASSTGRQRTFKTRSIEIQETSVCAESINLSIKDSNSVQCLPASSRYRARARDLMSRLVARHPRVLASSALRRIRAKRKAVWRLIRKHAAQWRAFTRGNQGER